jgi:hypothetical protein
MGGKRSQEETSLEGEICCQRRRCHRRRGVVGRDIMRAESCHGRRPFGAVFVAEITKCMGRAAHHQEADDEKMAGV